MANRELQRQSFLIVGLGQTGLSCARFLVSQGYAVAIMDTREQPPELSTLKAELPEVLVKTGGLLRDWLLRSDTIVLSPGVDPRLSEIKDARDSGVEIIGDIELFARYANAPIVAITGSNGKSTVTTMLAEMAVTAGKQIQVGGNLGIPALELIIQPAPDLYILELSSFQLETVESLNAYASVVLNITPDHLDRYDTEQAYRDAKAKIYAGSGVKVINQDDPIVNSWSTPQREQIGFTLSSPEDNNFGLINKNDQLWLAQGEQTLLAINDLKITGKHNVANALAALALGSAIGLPMPAMLTAIQSYRGLPHRCYLVAEYQGVRWLDDSKATNVGACLAAIEGIADSGNIILIAGGVAKDQSFSALTNALKAHVKAVVLLGQDAQLIADVIPDNVQQISASDMGDAVGKAQQIAHSGDNVLLSPACASFDMFTGYIERGEKFAQAVKELIV
ncbi:MAG: UDP-N-acetylmuramoyl-L-alanine--D-glutamate ligase [Gammaproteobacteria bacterium]|nr:MAG: UDP-N-acetylmuramoyl-L-alanine--D-glutamate ligase [Gammaproteobacteria bacterium]RLA01336.1 MAG: UDP-N-acetylmuramoyl-L-alanine--D-glutamate ligase [Gammaproteobacteria bacterium]